MVARVKKLTKQQHFLLRCSACDAAWTEARGQDAGHLTTGLCERGQRDAQHRRLWICTRPDVKAA
eukprot:6223361-Pyramimonas_sp.AAC.1